MLPLPMPLWCYEVHCYQSMITRQSTPCPRVGILHRLLVLVGNGNIVNLTITTYNYSNYSLSTIRSTIVTNSIHNLRPYTWDISMQCTLASGDTMNVPWTTRNGLYSSLHWGQFIIMLLQISTKEVLQIWTTSRLIRYRFATLSTKYYSCSKPSTCSLSKLITNCCFSCNCNDHPYTRKMAWWLYCQMVPDIEESGNSLRATSTARLEAAQLQLLEV